MLGALATLELLLPGFVPLAAGAVELLPEVALLVAGGVLLGRLGARELLGFLLPFGLEPLLGAVPFGVALGFKPPGVTPPPGVVGVPGASGGVTPGGDEFDGGAVEGDLLVDGATTLGDVDCADGADDEDEGDCDDGDVDDDGDEPAGAAGADCACAPVAAAKPSAAAATTTCNLSITVTSLIGVTAIPARLVPRIARGSG